VHLDPLQEADDDDDVDAAALQVLDDTAIEFVEQEQGETEDGELKFKSESTLHQKPDVVTDTIEDEQDEVPVEYIE
jgi:hypothetical protein